MPFTRDPELDLDDDGNPRADAVTRPSPPYEDPTHGMSADNHPAAGMTQLSALQFCKWLSDKTGEFYRLPTEAEWEYACNAGSTEPYFYGKQKGKLKNYAWFEKNSEKRTHPVGMLEPNPWGLYDMYGNVQEWTLDQYEADAYTKLNQDNLWILPSSLHPRSVRGGAYNSPAEDCRTANRIESDLDWKKEIHKYPRVFGGIPIPHL